MEDEHIEAMIDVAKAEVGLRNETTPFQRIYFGAVGVNENQRAVEGELRRYYRFTEHKCAECGAGIDEQQKDFIDQATDLDSCYLCKACCSARTKKCLTCDVLTESDTCKNCRSQSEEVKMFY